MVELLHHGDRLRSLNKVVERHVNSGRDVLVINNMSSFQLDPVITSCVATITPSWT